MTLILLTPLATQAKTVSKEHKTAATTIQLKKKSKKKSKQNSKKKSKHSRKTPLQSERSPRRNPRRDPRRDPSRSPRRGQSIPTHSNTFQTHKTIRIQSNIYQNELNKRFKDKELRTIVKLVTNGQIGYVGKFKDVKRIKDEINSKAEPHLSYGDKSNQDRMKIITNHSYKQSIKL